MQTQRKAFNNNKEEIQKIVRELKPNQYLRLRRMTPAEYLRFMGLSEKYIQRMVNSGNSDKELYKQGGNSIVVDVLYHIFYKMFIDRGSNIGESEPLF